jgi:hypothetical protein
MAKTQCGAFYRQFKGLRPLAVHSLLWFIPNSFSHFRFNLICCDSSGMEEFYSKMVSRPSSLVTLHIATQSIYTWTVITHFPQLHLPYFVLMYLWIKSSLGSAAVGAGCPYHHHRRVRRCHNGYSYHKHSSECAIDIHGIAAIQYVVHLPKMQRGESRFCLLGVHLSYLFDEP